MKAIIKNKILDYFQLIKLRLSLLVVFSAAMSYLWAANRQVDHATIWLLSIGGFLITASANILNQIFERDSDKLMKRTLCRPLPGNRMSWAEALVLSQVLGFAGLYLLLQINTLSFVLGVAALLTYAFVYTPLKKLSRIAVIPGAVAGSIPVIIGCAAANNAVGPEAIILFLIQFIWQFPHTWSIAWLLNEDYNKAGIKLLPHAGGKTTASAIGILVSTFLTIPAGLLLYMYSGAGIHVTWMVLLAGIVMLFFAYRFYKQKSDKAAVGLMLSCFAYLPVVLILLVIEKFI